MTPCRAGRPVDAFQVKDGQSFDGAYTGRETVDGDCKAKKKVKITKKTVFRTQSLDSLGATIATSPNVTVKLK